MARQKSPSTNKIISYLTKNPEATIDDIVQSTGVLDRKIVSNVRNNFRKKVLQEHVFTPEKLFQCQPTRIQIQLPQEGIELKVAKGGVLFTLTINESGITYMPSNAKKKPSKTVPWNFLDLYQKAAFSTS